MNLEIFFNKNAQDAASAKQAVSYLRNKGYPDDIEKLYFCLNWYTENSFKYRRFDNNTHTGQTINKALKCYWRQNRAYINQIEKRKIYAVSSFFAWEIRRRQLYIFMRALNINSLKKLQAFINQNKTQVLNFAREFEQDTKNQALKLKTIRLAPKKLFIPKGELPNKEEKISFSKFCINKLELDKMIYLLYALEQLVPRQ